MGYWRQWPIHSLARSLDPSLKCKVHLHIYIKITKFDWIYYANPRWQSGLMNGHLSGRMWVWVLPKTVFFFSFFFLNWNFFFSKVVTFNFQKMQYCVTIGISYSRVGSKELLIQLYCTQTCYNKISCTKGKRCELDAKPHAGH